MERNIVLTDKLEKVNLWLTLSLFTLARNPPALPVKALLAGLYKLISQLLCDGNVTDWRIEPNVENLVFITRLWNRNTPLKVSGNCALLKSIADPGLSHVDGIVSPAAFNTSLFHPFVELATHCRKIDVQVFCFANFWSSAAGMTAWLFKFSRIKQRTALIALVAAGLFVTALWTGSVNIAVCKEHIAVRTEKLLVYMLVNEAGLVQFIEKALSNFSTLLVGSAAEFIKINFKPFVDFCVLAIVVVAESARLSLFFKSLSFGCSTVFINTTNIKSVVTTAAAKACKNIARKRLNYISQMRNVINVR